jgi:hypothetical protein
MALGTYTAAVATVASRRQSLALMQVVAILTVFATPSRRCSPDVDLGVAP